MTMGKLEDNFEPEDKAGAESGNFDLHSFDEEVTDSDDEPCHGADHNLNCHVTAVPGSGH